MTLAVALALTACSDGDDDTDPGTTPPPTAATTEPPATTTPVATTEPAAPTTSPAPPTTVDEETLKAQIAEDFVATEQAREDLTRNPTEDDLDGRVQEVAAPGSTSFDRLRDFVRELVATEERIVPGSPDYSEVVEVESVELVSESQALVTACLVSNQVRAPRSAPVPATNTRLQAARIEQPMTWTPSGWRQSGDPAGLTIEEDVTSCSPL